MNSPDPNDRQFLQLQARRRVLQSRLLMVFAIGSTLVLIFCCVPLMVFQYLFGLDVTKDKVKVQAAVEKFGRLAVPADFSASQVCTSDNSLMQVNVIRFDHDKGRGKFVIGKLHLMFPPKAIPPGNDAKMLKTFIDPLMPRQRTLTTQQTRTKVVSIDGKDASFTIIEGEDSGSYTRMRQASGEFTGPQGVLQLNLQVEADFVTDEAIDALIDSLADVPETPSP